MDKPILSPLPWRLAFEPYDGMDQKTGDVTILAADDGVLLWDSSGEAFEDTAAYICHVVNAYDGLLAVQTAASRYLAALDGNRTAWAIPGMSADFIDATSETLRYAESELRAAILAAAGDPVPAIAAAPALLAACLMHDTVLAAMVNCSNCYHMDCPAHEALMAEYDAARKAAIAAAQPGAGEACEGRR